MFGFVEVEEDIPSRKDSPRKGGNMKEIFKEEQAIWQIYRVVTGKNSLEWV